MTSNGEHLFFAQHKAKTNLVILLSDFCNLNIQLKNKPYQMPKMCKMILQLEGFQYDTSLDLYIGFIIFVLAKRQATYLILSYHEEITGTNAHQWGSVTPYSPCHV